MAQLCQTSTHAVEHVRRGLYRLVVYGRCPNPNGTDLVEWVAGNKRKAFARLDQLLALPPSFLHSGQPLPPRVSERVTVYHVRSSGPLLPLGRVVATPGALALASFRQIRALLARHAAGDWGAVPPEDAAANDRARRTGARVLSAYAVPGGRLWILTEADRSATTVLLPSDY